MSDTRAKIVAAAREILLDGSASGPSVRAVAARAGVGASTLRHHFPSQPELMEAVMVAVYADAMPDERIGDVSVPAAERLVECLTNLLTPVGTAEQARELWRHLFRTFVDSDRHPGADAGYAVVVRHSRRRVESWLATLETQGALPVGDNPTRARYLLTVIDGLAINRALPDDGLTPAVESAILRAAVDAVLQLPWPVSRGT
jgi:AcrR family transcriptional regulator